MGARIAVRRHGSGGPLVLVLHGGPGAPGSAAGLARGLARLGYLVDEPLQRASGGEPLTVARHVEDLREVVDASCAARPATLVGWSWGAMLALCFAAAHPSRAGLLVLVGCGTWDEEARAELRRRRAARLSPAQRDEMRELERRLAAAGDDERDEVLARLGALLSQGEDDAQPGEAGDPDEPGEPVVADAKAFEETWNDLVRLQREGVYPAAFAAIDARVVMVHGTRDDHPGEMVRASLAPFVRRLEYVPLEGCGHEPWREGACRERLFKALRAALPPPA